MSDNQTSGCESLIAACLCPTPKFWIGLTVIGVILLVVIVDACFGWGDD